MRGKDAIYGVVVSILLLIFGGCGAHQPRPLELGRDQCAYCSMVVSDPKFGAELITAKGKIYPFDAIECLAAFVYTNKIPKDQIQSMWVADFEKVDKFIPAESAFYLHSPQIRSPMGMSLLAVSTEAQALRLQKQYDGEILQWPQVVVLVAEQWKLEKP